MFPFALIQQNSVFYPAVLLQLFVSVRWQGNTVNVCVTLCPSSSSLLYFAHLAQSVTLSAATTLPQRLPLAQMKTSSIRSERFYSTTCIFLYICAQSAHTRVAARLPWELVYEPSCSNTTPSHTHTLEPYEYKHSTGTPILNNRKTEQFLPEQIDRSER